MPWTSTFGDAVPVSPVGGRQVVIVCQVSADARWHRLLPHGEVERAAQAPLSNLCERSQLKLPDGHHGLKHLQQSFMGDFHLLSPGLF